ncbi:MAG: bifunctional riboflavin kinase/FAD synthetase [Anaerolineae bacterium]|nr:bifunctional riboflavin kinase/FAD synthetase [Anaerolineae bacterium]
MQIFQDLTSTRINRPTVLTIGTFDGIHLGHQALLKQLKESAQKQQAQTAVITFHPRPKTVLAPHLPANDYLTTLAERLALFEQLGLDALVVLPFTLAFAQTTAHDFMKLVTERINLIEFWAGYDFALGRNRAGNLENLTALGETFNYTVHEITPFLVDGQVVSSTHIRRLLLAGKVQQAAHFLGRFPSITGQVVAGMKRGRELGFPTTNLVAPGERLLPANGVYATFAHLPGSNQRLASVTNIGLRPSFEGDRRTTVETYIFDFHQTVYGQSLTLEFVKHLRPEKKFNSSEELVAQIGRDAKQARRLLAAEMDTMA